MNESERHGIAARARAFATRATALAANDDALATIARELVAFTRAADWTAAAYRPASAGEELLYPLFEAVDGASVYLVSDGEGTASPPHEHRTWAVVVGISGQECNRHYDVLSVDARTVRATGETLVGAGESCVLGEHAVHSTHVVGDRPTFHVHVYGRALRALPPFASRCYAIERT